MDDFSIAYQDVDQHVFWGCETWHQNLQRSALSDLIPNLKYNCFSRTDIYEPLDVAIGAQKPPNKWHLAKM